MRPRQMSESWLMDSWPSQPLFSCSCWETRSSEAAAALLRLPRISTVKTRAPLHPERPRASRQGQLKSRARLQRCEAPLLHSRPGACRLPVPPTPVAIVPVRRRPVIGIGSTIIVVPVITVAVPGTPDAEPDSGTREVDSLSQARGRGAKGHCADEAQRDHRFCHHSHAFVLSFSRLLAKTLRPCAR